MNTRDSKRILSVTVKRMIDEDSDSSGLGEFADTPEDYAIVHVGEHSGTFVSDLPCECGDSKDDHKETEDNYAPCSIADCGCDDFNQVEIQRGREYRYFNPNAKNYEGEPEEDIRKYCQQDYERMSSLIRGDWSYIGIRADARVQLNGNLTQQVTSGGLWGVETDAGDADFKEIEGEQLGELKDQLHAIGFTKRAIAAAFRNVERKEF